MTFQNACIILAIIFNLILIFSLLKYAKKSRSRTYFLFFVTAFLAWSISEILFRTELSSSPIFFTKLLYMCAGLIPTSFLLFCLTYPNNQRPSKIVSILIAIEIFVVAAIISFTSLLVSTSVPQQDQNHEVIFGPLYIFYILHIIAPFLIGFFLLIKKLATESNAIDRKKILDLSSGTIATLTLATGSNLFAPYFGINNLDWLGPIFTLLIVLFVTKGMLSEKIFGARIFFQRKVMTRAVVTALLLAYLATVYLGYLFFKFISSSHIQVDSKTIYHLVAFIATFICIIVFLTAILRSKTKKDIPRKIFIFMLFVLAGWIATLATSELITEPDRVLQWSRLPYFFIVWLSPSIILLFYSIIHKKLPSIFVKTALLLAALVILVISQTNLYIQGITINTNGSQEVITGILYGYDALYYILGIIIACFMAAMNWSKLDDSQKSTLRIIGPTYFFAVLPPAITQDILPALGFSYFFAPFGTLLGFFIIILGTSIAIYREKFLNIKLRIQRSFFLRSIALLTTLLYLAAIFIIYQIITLLRTNHENILLVLSQNGTSFVLLLSLIAFATYLILKKRETRTQKTFIFLVLAIIATLFGVILSSIVPYEKVLLCERLVYFSASWIPSLIFLLFYNLITNKKISWKKALIIFTPAIALVILGQTPLLIKSVTETAPFIYNDVRGPLFSIEALYYPVAFLAVLIVAVKNWHVLSPDKHRELRFLFVGFFISVLPSLIVNVILPHFFDVSRYYQLTFDLGVLLFIFVTSNAVLRFKFLHVRLFFKRRLITTAIISSLVVLYTSLLLLIASAIYNYQAFQSEHHIIIELTTKNILHIFTFLFLVVFSTFIASRKPENRQQRVFFIVLIIIGLWLALLTATEFAIGSNQSLLWWNRINYLPVLWFPMAMSYLYHNIMFGKNPPKYVFWIWLFAIATMHYIFLSPLFIESVIRTSPLGFEITPGILQPIEAPYFLAPFLVYGFLAIKHWKTIAIESRRQLKIILPGFLIASTPPVIADFFIYRFGHSVSLDQFTNFWAVFAFVFTTTAAIYNHRFLNLRIRITAALVRKFASVVLIVILLPIVIWLLITQQYFPQNFPGKVITISFIIFALYPLFNKILENPINRKVFKNTKTPAEIINEIVEKIGTIAKIEKLAPTLLQELVTQLNLKGAAYLARTDHHFELQEHVDFPEAKILTTLKLSDKTFEVLGNDNSYELGILEKSISDKAFIHELENSGAEVVVPFKVEKKVVGLLLLKEKKHNEAYSKDELHILDTLSFHLATTIHNAFLFGRVKNFANELQDKVKKATEALQAKNQELARIQEEKSQFFANIAHEFKTPITVMRGNIDIASNYLPKDQGVALQSEVERMNQLTSDLLELSRAETGQIKLNYENVDFSELIETVIFELTPLAQQKRITICNNIPKKVVIFADRTRLRHIVSNLISNAIKYNNDSGRIDIELSEDDNQICLTVADTGIGIPKEHLNKIFERFYRVDRLYSKKQGGTGLGLAIVKLMTELHGGTVKVESEMGKGTKFVICLPKKTSN